MSQRLPTPGGDDGDWGDILNAYLQVSLTDTGSLNNNVVGTAQLQNNAVTNAQLDSSTQSTIASVASKYIKPAGGIPSTDFTSAVQTSLGKADSSLQSGQLGAAGGIATLDGSSRLTSSQVPSGVVSVGSPTTNESVVWNGSSWSSQAYDPAGTAASAVSGLNLSGLAATAWAANTSYAQYQQVIAPTGDLVAAKTAFTSGSSYSSTNWNVIFPFSNQGGERLWHASNVLAIPAALTAAGSGSVTPVSGTAYLMGGPGCVIPAGRTANYINWQNNGAISGPTHYWAFLAVPDSTGATATVVATSVDKLTTAWAANTTMQFSLKSSDGGSGAFSVTTDTPVYIGLVQVATTPATIRGVSGSGTVDLITGTRPWWGSGPTGLTTPSSIAGDIAVGSSSLILMACSVTDS